MKFYNIKSKNKISLLLNDIYKNIDDERFLYE